MSQRPAGLLPGSLWLGLHALQLRPGHSEAQIDTQGQQTEHQQLPEELG
jgi:hypothetical protein